jgi:hypothetical protein
MQLPILRWITMQLLLLGAHIRTLQPHLAAIGPYSSGCSAGAAEINGCLANSLTVARHGPAQPAGCGEKCPPAHQSSEQGAVAPVRHAHLDFSTSVGGHAQDPIPVTTHRPFCPWLRQRVDRRRCHPPPGPWYPAYTGFCTKGKTGIVGRWTGRSRGILMSHTDSTSLPLRLRTHSDDRCARLSGA